jgi:hypothetical protein
MIQARTKFQSKCASSVTHTVQLVSVLVSDVNGDELPVHFTLVDHSVATEHFSLYDSSCSMQLGANLASVYGIVVTYVDILRKYAALNI